MSRLGGYYNDEDVGREGRYITRGFLAGYPGSYDRFTNDVGRWSSMMMMMMMMMMMLTTTMMMMIMMIAGTPTMQEEATCALMRTRRDG